MIFIPAVRRFSRRLPIRSQLNLPAAVLGSRRRAEKPCIRPPTLRKQAAAPAAVAEDRGSHSPARSGTEGRRPHPSCAGVEIDSAPPPLIRHREKQDREAYHITLAVQGHQAWPEGASTLVRPNGTPGPGGWHRQQREHCFALPERCYADRRLSYRGGSRAGP